MKPYYTNFDDLETEIKQLSLERQIAWEELKLLKTEVKDDFRPYNWIEPIVKGASKYGVFMLFRKLFSR